MAEELQCGAAEGWVGRPMASPAVASLGTQWQGEEERVLCTLSLPVGPVVLRWLEWVQARVQVWS